MLSDKAWSKKYRQRQYGTMWELVGAICGHYAVKMYLAVSLAGLIVFAAMGGNVIALPVAVLLTVIFYPLVEYVLHRYVLHSNLFYRSAITAPVWRRLHYDHHMDPNNLSVLFASPLTSAPLLVLLAAIPAAILHLEGLFPAMLTTNFLMFTYYEFMHASAHLKLDFQNSWIASHKQSHLRHHFICETQNYGIGTRLMDRVAGTADKSSQHSTTVRNLGYDDEVAEVYPWVRDGYERDHGLAQRSTGNDPADRQKAQSATPHP
ncbi:sterol desaturase family protein [Roseibium sp. M-1]